ncbi:rhodanese-like domain-containing protein [Paracoccus thiocyanatus]|uniref:Sulfurtransferase n=1 Tax=Paracoccus thiocyanatus TaxID=34006 RepID=A0A1N6VQF5_9RHOB|nr:rhodanese-like domain-containing protein [Paracoccus thiocyanatus]RDW12609.1 sulfurtransferase [Paracoccus thiocyanatus]SIQ80055.1 Rhodanese-related sulfurtransferase [Paracoccus thiocyanatus]
MRAILFALALSAFSPLAPAWADDAAALPENKQTVQKLYLTAQEAYEKVVQAPQEVLFLDVRSPGEVIFVGMPTVADANVPHMIPPATPVWDDKRGTFKMESNPGFVDEVRARLKAKGLGEDAAVVLICRSGDRSAKAANDLAKAGFGNVWSVTDGFEGDMAKDGPLAGTRSVNGWKNAGLPWTYKLDKAKMHGI